MTARLAVAVVGCGRIGRRRAEAAALHPSTRLAAVADSDAGRARSLARELRCGWSGNWRKTVRDPAVDIVVISTFNDALAPVACAALRAGKHVLLEKPMGRNLAEAGKIVREAGRARGILKVGFNHRYHPALKEARRALSSGVIGKPLFLRCRYGHGGRAGYEKEWRCDPRRAGGGELTDQGVHVLDLAQWFFGAPRKAAAFLQTAFWPIRPLEDNGFVLLRYGDGRTAAFHTSWTQWKNLFDFEVYGSKGSVEVEGLGGSYGPETLTVAVRGKLGRPPRLRRKVFGGPDRSWAEEWDDFVRCVGRGTRPQSGARESLLVMRALDAVYRSQRSGKIATI